MNTGGAGDRNGGKAKRKGKKWNNYKEGRQVDEQSVQDAVREKRKGRGEVTKTIDTDIQQRQALNNN